MGLKKGQAEENVGTLQGVKKLCSGWRRHHRTFTKKHSYPFQCHKIISLETKRDRKLHILVFRLFLCCFRGMKIIIDSFRKYITPLCCIHCECWFFWINFNWLLSMNWQKIGILRASFNLWVEASRMWHSDKVHIFCESHISEEIFLLVLMVIRFLQIFCGFLRKAQLYFITVFLIVVIPSIYR